MTTVNEILAERKARLLKSIEAMDPDLIRDMDAAEDAVIYEAAPKA